MLFPVLFDCLHEPHKKKWRTHVHMLFGEEHCLKRIKLLSPTLVIQKGALVRNEPAHTSREVLEGGRVRRGSFTASQPYIPSPISLEPLLYTCRNTLALANGLFWSPLTTDLHQLLLSGVHKETLTIGVVSSTTSILSRLFTKLWHILFDLVNNDKIALSFPHADLDSWRGPVIVHGGQL